MITGILIIAAATVLLPVAVGALVSGPYERELGRSSPVFRWVSGQMILWAGFLLVSVPLILTQGKLWTLLFLYGVLSLCLVLAAVFVSVRRNRNRKFRRNPSGKGQSRDRTAAALWGCAAVLFLFQLVMACAMAYEEGDDAYYVAVSAVAESGGTMYYVLPYTGGVTELDLRHALAPMPMWVACLARVSGIPSSAVAHVILPVVLITMAHGTYYLLSRRLFPEGGRKAALFMLLIQVLVLFGGYSLYSAENFLLVRTAQGKAILASLVIPFLFLLFLTIAEQVQEEQKPAPAVWVSLAAALAAGCLCSTEGSGLVALLMGAVGICTVVCYRRWKLFIPMAGCLATPVCMSLLYFLLD